MKKLIVGALLIHSTTGAAADSKFLSALGNSAEYTAYFVASSYLAVLTHEYGHAAAAKAYGATDIEVEAGISSGVTTYYEGKRMSGSDDAVISLAGNTVNRLNAGWSNLLLPVMTDGTWKSKFLATFYLVNRAFVVEEWIRAAGAEDADFYKASESLSSRSFSRDQVYAIFGAVIAADLWWSWRTIRDNSLRFSGKQVTAEAPAADFHFAPMEDGARFALRASF
jgi:hypothetical protein